MARPPAGLADWLFSAPAKRRLLTLLSHPDALEKQWSEAELARELGVARNGSLDEHLHALVQIGLVERSAPARYRVVPPRDLAPHLAALRSGLFEVTQALTDVPNDRVMRPK